jgi:hypothetical protein
VWCVSDFGAHNEDLGVVKLCAFGTDDSLPVLFWQLVFLDVLQ